MRGKFLPAARRAGTILLDLVLPPQCPTCDRQVAAPGRFCADCFRQAAFILEPCCVRCGVGFSSQGEAGLALTCDPCLAEPPRWREARAAFSYDDFSRRLILPLKYGDRTENAAFLAVHMLRAGRKLLQRADLLVPVPLHRKRLFTRRYNQAGLLARHLGRSSSRPVMIDALLRVRSTRSLSTCTAEERREEIEGAIACRASRRPELAGRHVMLIDDVLTTGSTAGACVAALLLAGAASVDLLVAARAAASPTSGTSRTADRDLSLRPAHPTL